jgi:aminoglycoside phosphotransferase (APT) family kinase protein
MTSARLEPPTATAIAAALYRHLHDPIDVVAVHSVSAGAASDTFAVDAVRHGEHWRLILQRAPMSGPVVGALSKQVLADLQRRLHRSGLPVAEVIFSLNPEDHLGDGYIMARIAGETLAPRYLRDPAYAAARAAMTAQVAETLAHIHAVPIATLSDLPLADDPPPLQVDRLEALYRALSPPLPVFELALGWLRRHLPPVAPPALVHGDYRSGNFVVSQAGLEAVLDWELAHIGDPLEDLGWIAVNSWRFGQTDKPIGGFAERAPFYRAYAKASGRRLERPVLLFWEVYGTLRWGLSCLQLAHQHLSGAVMSVERAAIGRRVSEVEIDLLHLIRHGDV